MADKLTPDAAGTGGTTDRLGEALHSAASLTDFLKENEKSFISAETGPAFRNIIRAKRMPRAKVAERAGMSEVYLYQVLSGKRVPSRDRVLCMCLAMGCTVEETQEILQKCRYAILYPRDRRDAVILYAIDRKLDIYGLNDALLEAKEKVMI